MSNTKVKSLTPNMVLTEDLGKIFEMAICLTYSIPFNGKYKYSMDEAYILQNKLTNTKLSSLFGGPLIHTAKNGSQYDFTGMHDDTIKLSAKTTKKDGKVCPQVIGQPSKKKFCEFFKIAYEPISEPNTNTETIKEYIQCNIQTMLHKYFDLTFDCPILYYNKHTDRLLFVKQKAPIDWSKYVIEFSHIKKQKIWRESSTISINNETIGEFQVHNHRDCIKFRWVFEKILKIFDYAFDVTVL